MEFKAHFTLTYCDVVPRDDVPSDLLARFPGDDEKFYRVKSAPSYTLTREPVRVIPGYMKPADPEQNQPEKWIPERKIGPTHASLKGMITHQIFAGSQL